jgi:hypothetical protein
MSLYRDVTNKPWDQIGLPDGIEHSPVFAVSNERLALNVFYDDCQCDFFAASCFILHPNGYW